jgi:hypothetical protein
MAVGIGLTGFIGYGKETTYGTSVARAHFLEINEEDIVSEEPKIESAALAQVGIRSTKVAQGGIAISGNFGFDAQYGGWERLLRQLMGTIVSSQPDVTSNATVWDHTFTIADELPTGLTIEVFRGTETFLTEPNKSFLYTGCLITSMDLSCGVDDLLKVSFSIMGQDVSRVAKSTPSYSSTELAVYHQGTVQWNGEDVEASNFQLTLNNALEARPKLGSRLTRAPKRSGKLDVSGSFQAEFVHFNQFDDFRNATNRQMVITFLGPIITGTFRYTITITIAIAKINTFRVVLNQPGRLLMEIGFKAYRTDSAGEISIVMRNNVTPSLTN